MNNYGARRPRKKKQNSSVPFLCIIIVWLLILGAVLIFATRRDGAPEDTGGSQAGTSPEITDGPVGTDGGTETAAGTETEAPPEPVTYKEATVLSAGDIIPHLAQIYYAAAAGGNGTYDFTNTFKYVKDVVSAADYAVVNFEANLAGPSLGYNGYPFFNAPDTLVDAVMGAGFDMTLYANNHCYDTGFDGFIRTQQQFDEHGIDYIGAKQDPADAAYKVVDINGIKVGMFNYTDDLAWGKTSPRTINGITIRESDLPYMNVYNLSLLDEFYSEIDSVIAAMRAEGADIVVAYMHWGYEYNIQHNADQEKVAQALCDRGVDIIIGGHPHVMQDVEVLTSSSDPQHKVICFYSLGNFVSNQSRHTPDFDVMNMDYTDAGLMVKFTVRKYSTGESMITKVEAIPTFIHRFVSTNWHYAHEIVPIATALEDPAAFGLTSSNYGESDARDAYEKETALLGGAVEAYNDSIVLPAVGEPEG